MRYIKSPQNKSFVSLSLLHPCAVCIRWLAVTLPWPVAASQTCCPVSVPIIRWFGVTRQRSSPVLLIFFKQNRFYARVLMKKKNISPIVNHTYLSYCEYKKIDFVKCYSRRSWRRYLRNNWSFFLQSSKKNAWNYIFF